MDSVKLPTAPPSLHAQMSHHHFHHIPLLPPRNFRSKPVIGIVRSRSHVSPLAVLFRQETSLAPLDLPLPPRLNVSPNSLQYPPGYLGAVPERASDHDSGSIVEAMEYLTNILSTKVYDIAVESPLHLAKKLSERLGVRMLLKREDLQPVSITITLIFFG